MLDDRFLNEYSTKTRFNHKTFPFAEFFKIVRRALSDRAKEQSVYEKAVERRI